MSKLQRVAGDSERYFFECPGCKDNHLIPVKSNTGPNWQFNGDMERPTFSPSIKVETIGGRGENHTPEICHSFVQNGNIQFLSDCTHALAGKMVPLGDV